MRLTFEGFDVDLESGQLILAGHPVTIERRAFEMLAYLAAHPNRLISKDELLSEVWQARSLSEGVVMNAATKLRKAFGQAPSASEPIETVRGRGYRLRARPLLAHVSSAPADADPFVGRGQVVQALEQVLERALEGQGQLLLLTGEAGIGKTRTLDELAKRARIRGFSVWEGAAYDGAGVPAYWPWVEILRAAHADMSRSMFRQHVANDSWALALLVPELLDPKRGDLDPQTEATRFRLFDELARFLQSASAAAPRLIIADDLHWADEGTLELFVYAARSLKKRGIVLALALREHMLAATSGDARAELLARLCRHATLIQLSGLAPEEVQQLVAALAPQHLTGSALGASLYERTSGNPFFVRQMLALFSQSAARGPMQSERVTLPQAVRDLLHQRVAALDPEAQAVLRVAAAVGTEFELSVLASALERPVSEVLGALTPALRRGVIVESVDVTRVQRAAVIAESTEQRFVFGHVLLRETVYDALDLVERGHWHARLARVLEQRAPLSEARALGELARHHLLALPCDLDACVRHCQRAAEAARAALGFEAAAELLARASDKLASEGGDVHTRCELLLSLGQDRFCVGHVKQAWQALQLGATLAAQLGAADLLARLVCRLAAWLELGGGDEEVVRAWLERALAMIGDSHSELRAALLAHRAEMCFELPMSERLRLLDEADALAAQSGTPEVLLEIALCRASLRDPTALDESRRAIERYRALARQHRRVLSAPQRLLQEFGVELSEYVRAVSACELDVGDAVIERCRSIARESQVPAVALGAELLGAGRALGDGRLDDMTAAVERLREGSSLAGGFSLVWAACAMRLFEAKESLQSLAGLLADPPPGLEELRPTQQMNGRLWLARLHAKLGAHDKARRMLASVPRDQLARMPVRYGDLGTLCFLAEIYCELSDEDNAAALYQKLLPYAERNAVGAAFDYSGAVAHYLGLLAALLGEPLRAAEHFATAERINHMLRMPREAAASAKLRRELVLRIRQTGPLC